MPSIHSLPLCDNKLALAPYVLGGGWGIDEKLEAFAVPWWFSVVGGFGLDGNPFVPGKRVPIMRVWSVQKVGDIVTHAQLLL